MHRTILLEDGAVVRRHQKQNIQIGPSWKKFPPNRASIQQHTFQLLGEPVPEFTHVDLQQLLYLIGQPFNQTFSHFDGSSQRKRMGGSFMRTYIWKKSRSNQTIDHIKRRYCS